jgi:magnesium-transporting ATPase (P-type)
VSIISAILLIICIAAWADWFKDSRFVKLQETILDMTVPVIRGKFGNTLTVSVWDTVVGDVILLKAGDRVSSDCLIIESADLVAE